MKKLLLATTLMILSASTASYAVDATKDAAKDTSAKDSKCHGMKDHHGDRDSWMMKKFDTNHDGVISKEEFNAANDKFFNELDTNHDGKITKDEMDAFGKKKEAEFKAHHEEFMKKYDTNHDGKLDASEKAAMHKEMESKRNAEKAADKVDEKPADATTTAPDKSN